MIHIKVNVGNDSHLYVESVKFTEAVKLPAFYVRLVRNANHVGIFQAGIGFVQPGTAGFLDVRVSPFSEPQSDLITMINNHLVFIELPDATALMKAMTEAAVAPFRENAAKTAQTSRAEKEAAPAPKKEEATAPVVKEEKPATRKSKAAAPAPVVEESEYLTDDDSDLDETEYESEDEVFDDPEEEGVEQDDDSDDDSDEAEGDDSDDDDADGEIELSDEQINAYIRRAIKARSIEELRAIAEELMIELPKNAKIDDARNVITGDLGSLLED
jgi:hypothetical protein